MSIEDKVARRVRGLMGRIDHVETLLTKPHNKQESRLVKIEIEIERLSKAVERLAARAAGTDQGAANGADEGSEMLTA